MNKIIEFKNVNFAYNSLTAFNDFNMVINEGEIVSLIGPSESGKTTLLKMLCHKLPNENCYYYGNSFADCDINELKRDIVVVFDTPITEQTLKEELIKYLKYLNFDEYTIDEKYNSIREKFDLDVLDEKGIDGLSYQELYLIKILRYLILMPRFIAIDNLFANIIKENKEKIIEFIKSNNITLLNVVTDLNDTLYGERTLVLENFTLILEGNTLSVLKADTLLKRLGFKLPLAVDLSIELSNYEVLKKIYTDNSKLVGALWK